ncbi:Integrin beta-6 [Holothuria leucospilota]|uniref:Integrin beta n=1 Tax=Holothuria leucospilota TaxID=206669 RepID=A0A9Q1BG66_HOLLE|nr:Integrin beta-6 [Holothuria leucospilota]
MSVREYENQKTENRRNICFSFGDTLGVTFVTHRSITSITAQLKVFRLNNMVSVTARVACLVIVFNVYSFAEDVGVTSTCPILSKKCGDCIIIPGCAWCKNESYTEARCDTVDNLRENGCDNYENPETTIETIRNESLSDGTYVNEDGDETIAPAVQIQPQEITLKLRQGETKRIRLNVRQAIDYPVDLYYLMDLSHSMADDLRSLKILAERLADSVKGITRRIKLGFGSFVDKPMAPYINITEGKIDEPCRGCEKTYSFRNAVPLTGDLEHFEAEISRQTVSGNLDKAEGTFDAMMQVAACSDQIGWRQNARHLLLVTTDAPYHVQGDGRVAGVIKPHDGGCHLNDQNEYSDSHIYDYPSVGQLNQKLVENNILPIFSVGHSQFTKFSVLSELMQGARVAALNVDSSNILIIIKTIYQEITSNVKLTHNAPQNLDVKFTAYCGDGVTNEIPPSCSNIMLGREVSFDIDITASSCFDGASNQTSFDIYPIGLDERLTVNVEVHCSCPCESFQDFNSSFCTNGNGTLVCGVCACNQGHYGEYCQCLGQMEDEQTGSIQCKPHNQTDVICSGRGNCICGECHCHNNTETGGESSSGPYCECSDRKCPIFGGEVCGGPERGTCECIGGRINRCKCNPGYAGESCGCPTRTDTCIAQNGLICNAEGNCECGRCVCSSSKYYGEHCEQCVTCSECDLHVNCVKCKVFGEGLTESECDMCSQTIQEVDKITKSNDTSFKQCSYTDDDKCTVFFTWKKLEENDTILVSVQKTPQCATKKPHELPLFWIIIGTTVAVVMMGVLLLLLIRCYHSYLDRKEYNQFLKSQQDANWQKSENPLYNSGIQTYKNPMYGKS